jgi:hypothetical protein
VVQVLSGLDSSLALDHTVQWNDISKHVSQDIMPAIDRAMRDRVSYTQTELKYVLQQLHRHRRDNWKISLDSAKSKADKKRKGTNSRHSEVSNS